MKRCVFFLLVFCFTFACARSPIIDYKSIAEWCTTYLPSDDNELKPLKEYLELGKEWAHNCVNDPNFNSSPESKKLLEAMQTTIEQCLHNDVSKLCYEKLVLLIKHELAINTNNTNCGKKRMYKVLAMVYEGCLHCVLGN